MFSSKKSKPNTYFQNLYILSNLTPYIFVRFKLKKKKKNCQYVTFFIINFKPFNSRSYYLILS